MTEYNREQWIKPITIGPEAHALIRRITLSRLSGNELKPKRPAVMLRIVANDQFMISIKPKLASSPTGWTIAPLIDVVLTSRIDGKTEIKVRLHSDGSMGLANWKRDDARNAVAVDLVRSTLERFVGNPRKAFAISADGCGVCGRPLTDPLSREMGIGPECREQFERAIRIDEQAMEQQGGAE
jgi:hypothetical protein